MSKYSRAPWRTHLINETVVVSADAEIVAQIEGDYDNDAERMAADACLIAAAPALLEALDDANKLLVQAFNRIHTLPRTTDTELADRLEHGRGKIRAAIAAAKGDA